MLHNIGIHLKDYKKIDKYKKYPINYIQIFPDVNYNIINKIKEKYNLKIIVHSSYTINLAKQFDIHSIFLEMFIKEIKYTHNIKSKYIVIHIGKYLELNIQNAINNIVLSLIYIVNKTEQYNDVNILLETSSGQGTEIGYKLEEFAEIYNRVKHIKRIKICLDTCHVYTAGYDINDFNTFKNKFDKLIGLENIKVIHLNNSENNLGAKIDKHSNLNNGNIKNLVKIAEWFIKKYNTIIILETPEYKIEEDIMLLT